MSASADAVTVERGGEDSRYVFLDARTASSLWSIDTGGEDTEFLLGGRYVITTDDDAIEGHALRTGRRLWRTAVAAHATDAPGLPHRHPGHAAGGHLRPLEAGREDRTVRGPQADRGLPHRTATSGLIPRRAYRTRALGTR